jgi:hypothetical protein
LGFQSSLLSLGFDYLMYELCCLKNAITLRMSSPSCSRPTTQLSTGSTRVFGTVSDLMACATGVECFLAGRGITRLYQIRSPGLRHRSGANTFGSLNVISFSCRSLLLPPCLSDPGQSQGSAFRAPMASLASKTGIGSQCAAGASPGLHGSDLTPESIPHLLEM